MGTMHDPALKADKAEAAMWTAKSIAGLSLGYTVISAFGHVEPASVITNTGKVASVINAVADFNGIAASFIENVSSIDLLGNVLGAVVGLGIASVAGLYSRRQRKKVTAFRTQANKLHARDEGISLKDKGLII